MHKNRAFKALEQDLPHLCADRLEYITHEGFLEGLYSPEDIQQLYQSLKFESGHWVVHDKHAALKLATTALYLTKRHWAAPWNVACYHWGARALKRAMDSDVMTETEFHFGYDDDMWHRLKTSTDEMILQCLNNMMNSSKEYSQKTEQGMHITPKFRGIDPLIKIDNDRQYLSEIDEAFKSSFELLKDELQRGYYLNL